MRNIDHFPCAHAQLGPGPATQAWGLTQNPTSDLLGLCGAMPSQLGHSSQACPLEFSVFCVLLFASLWYC